MVSVIITTINEEEVIEKLLRSIKKQTYKDIEIILVDNPKTKDRTREIAKKYTNNVFIKGPERSVQRNFGVSKAKGKYVMILDADMILGAGVVKECVDVAESAEYKALVIPEKTVGRDWLSKVRRFEREMYEGDLGIEVSRFYLTKVFQEMKGFDINLTGPEDYDLHYRVMKKYKVGRIKRYLYHFEEDMNLSVMLHKKYKYAKEGARYVDKHPELIRRQGTIIFRKTYIRNWKKFVKHPFLGILFIFVRILETIWAVSGFISAVGFKKFIVTLFTMFNKNLI